MINRQGRIEHVLKALSGADVRFLVVGGVAVVLHGHLRTTIDLDLVLSLEFANVDRALAVLSDLGFEPLAPVPLRAFADPENRATWARDRNMTVFSLWHANLQGFAIDLFVQEPFDFEDAYERAVVVNLGTAQFAVVGLEDLIKMKTAANRDQDRIDVRALSAIAKARGESK